MRVNRKEYLRVVGLKNWSWSLVRKKENKLEELFEQKMVKNFQN